MSGNVQGSLRTGMKSRLKVGVTSEQCFGTVLLSLGLLWRANDYLSNSDCAALRAMTDPKCESAVLLLFCVHATIGTLWRILRCAPE